jgi:hypothetical protein
MTYELTERTGTEKRARKAKRTAPTAASDRAGAAVPAITPFNYENDVDHPINAKIITQAATVVYREQNVCLVYVAVTIHHLDVPRIPNSRL